MSKRLLGIIGGLGPMSSAYFYELITAHTKVNCDQDHLDLVLSSRASTPDRTAYILGNSNDSPLPFMIEDAKRLENYGVDEIVIICNTAHYFIDEVRKNVSIPVISMIEETAKYLNFNSKIHPAILATDGTIKSKAYQEKLDIYNIGLIVPDDKYQESVMDIIYNYIKKGITPPQNMLLNIEKHCISKGCDSIICGCTEISLAIQNFIDKDKFIDPLEILTYKVLTDFNKPTIGFENYNFE